MTVSVVASADNAALTVTTSIATSTTLTPASGERLIAFVTNDVAGGVEVPTVSGAGGTWEYLGNIVETGNQQLLAFENRSPTTGAAATITATWLVGVDARAIRAHRIAGSNLSISSAIKQNWQPLPTTATDAVTSTNVTPNTALGILVALSICTHGAGGLPSAGSGFTSIGTFWNFGAGALTRDEYATHATNTPIPGTFTATGNIDHLTIVLAIGEGGPTISAQPVGAHVAVGATHSMSVTASASAGGGTLSYQWQVNGTNVSTGAGGTTANYTTGALTAADDGNVYRCLITEAGGSSDGTATSDGATVRVGPLLVASSTAVYTGTGTPTTIAPAWPTTAIAAGDVGKVVLIVGMKPATSGAGSVTTPTSPSVWTSHGSIQAAGGYTAGGASAADTGNCDLYVFSIDDPGTTTGTITVTLNVGATTGVAWAAMHRCSGPPGSTFSIALVTGSDIAGGSVSITFGSDPGVKEGDLIIGAMCIPTDVTTPSQFSAYSFTQAGITFSSVTEIQEPDSGNNNDIGGFMVVARATAGTSSAAPVLTATAGGTTTNVRGPGIFLRIRAAADSVAIVAAPTPRQVIPRGFDRKLPPFWPPSPVGSFVNVEPPTPPEVVTPAQGQVSMPTVPGVFDRKLPPFWPPSPVGSFVNPAPGATVLNGVGVSVGGLVGVGVPAILHTAMGIAFGSQASIGTAYAQQIGAGVATTTSVSVSAMADTCRGVGVSTCYSASVGEQFATNSATGVVCVSSVATALSVALASAGGICTSGILALSVGTVLGTGVGVGSGKFIGIGVPANVDSGDGVVFANLAAIAVPYAINKADGVETARSVSLGSVYQQQSATGVSAGGGAGIGSSLAQTIVQADGVTSSGSGGVADARMVNQQAGVAVVSVAAVAPGIVVATGIGVAAASAFEMAPGSGIAVVLGFGFSTSYASSTAAGQAVQTAPGISAAGVVALAVARMLDQQAGVSAAGTSGLAPGSGVAVLSVPGVMSARSVATATPLTVSSGVGVAPFAGLALGVGQSVDMGNGVGVGVSVGYVMALSVGRALQVVDGVAYTSLVSVAFDSIASTYVPAYARIVRVVASASIKKA